MTSVSVIIPVYNGARFVRDAIDSALAQTMTDREILVVDDGSTDETPDILASYGTRIRVHRQANAGVASARNAGAAIANGRFLAFLDADDVWLPQKLARQLPLLDDEDVALVYSGIRRVDEALRPIAHVEPASPEHALVNTLCAQPPLVPLTMTGVVRRTVFTELGGFDERLSTSADGDFVCRLALRHRVDRVAEPLALYRQHDQQMHLNLKAMEHDMRLLYEKFFADPAARPFRRWRRRGMANVYYALAGAYAGDRAIGQTIRCGAAALWWSPARVLQLATRKR